jgi:hypothetical protein
MPVFRFSRVTYRKAIERFARYFRREFDYDFLLYQAEEEAEVPTVAFLFVSNELAVRLGYFGTGLRLSFKTLR